jgi:hypothetical protein
MEGKEIYWREKARIVWSIGGKERTLTNIRWRLPCARQIVVCNSNDTWQISYSPSASTFSLVLLGAQGMGSGVPLVYDQKHKGTSMTHEKIEFF